MNFTCNCMLSTPLHPPLKCVFVYVYSDPVLQVQWILYRPRLELNSKHSNWQWRKWTNGSPSNHQMSTSVTFRASTTKSRLAGVSCDPQVFYANVNSLKMSSRCSTRIEPKIKCLIMLRLRVANEGHKHQQQHMIKYFHSQGILVLKKILCL